jgi:hypothetical protein
VGKQWIPTGQGPSLLPLVCMTAMLSTVQREGSHSLLTGKILLVTASAYTQDLNHRKRCLLLSK